MNSIAGLTRRNIAEMCRHSKLKIFSGFLFQLLCMYIIYLRGGHFGGVPPFVQMGEMLAVTSIFTAVYTAQIMGQDIENSLQVEPTANRVAHFFDFHSVLPCKGFDGGWRIGGHILKPELSRKLTISYFITGTVTSSAANIIIWSLMSLIANHGAGAAVFFPVCGLLVLASAVGSALMTLFTAAARDTNSAILFCFSSIMLFSVMCGFLPPADTLGNWSETVGSLIPFTHFAVWIKRIMLNAGFIGADAPPALVLVYIAVFCSIMKW
jgi:hypothetical protein